MAVGTWLSSAANFRATEARALSSRCFSAICAREGLCASAIPSEARRASILRPALSVSPASSMVISPSKNALIASSGGLLAVLHHSDGRVSY